MAHPAGKGKPFAGHRAPLFKKDGGRENPRHNPGHIPSHKPERKMKPPKGKF